ncbi:TPA: hypothetical protein I6841_003553 [Vibrio cholerae]|nr:hypothetical protein [Vibrio cholerae]
MLFSYAPIFLSTRITLRRTLAVDLGLSEPQLQGFATPLRDLAIENHESPTDSQAAPKSDTQTERKLKMAQRNSTLTRSNMTQATSVSTLDPESSPKNDISKRQNNSYHIRIQIQEPNDSNFYRWDENADYTLINVSDDDVEQAISQHLEEAVYFEDTDLYSSNSGKMILASLNI